MIKKILLSLFTILFLLTIFIIYLNFFGIETNNFNNSIKKEIKSYDKRIDVELKKVKVILNLRNFTISI